MRIRPSTTLSCFLVATSLLSVGCGKKEAAKLKSPEIVRAQKQASTAPQLPAPAPRKSENALPPTPEPAPSAPSIVPVIQDSPVVVTTSVNGGVKSSVTAGWPVVVEVRLLLKPSAGASLTLSNSQGPWSDSLKLEFIGADGTDRTSLFSRAYASENKIELTRARSGLMVWVLDAVDTKRLPEGSYRVRAFVDEKKLGGALPSGLASSRALVVVGPSTEILSAGAAQQKCLAIMTASAWKSDFEKSLATADTYLATQPKDIAVLFMKGKVQRSQGKKEAALASFEAALLAASENKNVRAENFAIQQVIEDLQRELAVK